MKREGGGGEGGGGSSGSFSLTLRPKLGGCPFFFLSPYVFRRYCPGYFCRRRGGVAGTRGGHTGVGSASRLRGVGKKQIDTQKMGASRPVLAALICFTSSHSHLGVPLKFTWIPFEIYGGAFSSGCRLFFGSKTKFEESKNKKGDHGCTDAACRKCIPTPLLPVASVHPSHAPYLRKRNFASDTA